MAMLAGWQRMGSGGRDPRCRALDTIAARILAARPAHPAKCPHLRPIPDRAAWSPALTCPAQPHPTKFRPRVALPADACSVRRGSTVLNPMEETS